MYDIYGDTQLKIGEVSGQSFKVGEKVPLSDGVYIGNEGIVVVIDGKFVAEFSGIHTKWDDEIDLRPILEKHSPVVQAVREISGREKELQELGGAPRSLTHPSEEHHSFHVLKDDERWTIVASVNELTKEWAVYRAAG